MLLELNDRKYRNSSFVGINPCTSQGGPAEFTSLRIVAISLNLDHRIFEVANIAKLLGAHVVALPCIAGLQSYDVPNIHRNDVWD